MILVLVSPENLVHMAVPVTTLNAPANVKLVKVVLTPALLVPVLLMVLVIMATENMLLPHIPNAVGLVLIAILAQTPTDKVVLIIIKNVHIVMNADV